MSGFRAGTIYYPTSTADGTFGAVAISPGFTATQSSIAWLGPRLASFGFVVITIDTNTTSDQPDSRGDQLQAALDYLVSSRSGVASRIDRTRLAVMGHSMGGGGTLSAARDNPALQAAIPLTAWHATKNWSTVQVPTLVIGAQNDTVASVSSHSRAVLQLAAGQPRQGVPRAGGGQPLRPQQLQHDDRQVLGLVAQAVRRQRHPLRAVPVPQPQRLGHLGVPLDLPLRRRHDADDHARHRPTPPTTAPPAPSCQWWQWWCWLGL